MVEPFLIEVKPIRWEDHEWKNIGEWVMKASKSYYVTKGFGQLMGKHLLIPYHD